MKSPRAKGKGRSKATTPQAKGEPSPAEMLLDLMIPGVLNSRAIYVAAKLRLADLVDESPKTAAELAKATGSHAPSLYRILRHLASIGVFAEDQRGRFGMTPLAATLRTGSPSSLHAMAIFWNEDYHWRAFGDVLHSVRTGETAMHHLYGTDLFGYLAKNPELGRGFDEAMTSFSTFENAAIASAYDFSRFRILVDVAGGHGSLLAEILRANPNVRGILFDQPHVVGEVQRRFEGSPIAGRLQVRAGDMFESVPEGGDAYLLKNIIHDWADEEAIAILRNCRRGMPADGKLLLGEIVLPTGNEPHIGKLSDLEMMVLTEGRERSEDEFRTLLAQAGFRLAQVVPTSSHMCVVEAVPV